MSDILVNFSVAKKYLAQNGLRCQPSAVEELRNLIKNYADGIAEKASEIAEQDKRKTIKPEDVIDATTAESD